MSSFKDNFTRGSGDSNLQYDDTAFYYFAVSMLSSISLILFFFIVRRILSTDQNLIKRLNKADITLPEKLKNHSYNSSSQKYNWTFKLLIFFFVAAIYLTYTTSLLITKKDTMKRFDPYEVLDITRGATLPEIRKAYRRMMLMYHPDKNPTPEAAAKFLLVTKANECLTDESKRVVCEQFGSPDGPGTLHVAIAMPSFFQKKENHIFILTCFSVFFILFLPTAVLWWLNSSQKYDSHGVSVENYKNTFAYLSQNMAPSRIIEIIGFCEEFKFKVSKQEQEYFRKHQNIFYLIFLSIFNNLFTIFIIKEAGTYSLILNLLIYMPFFGRSLSFFDINTLYKNIIMYGMIRFKCVIKIFIILKNQFRLLNLFLLLSQYRCNELKSNPLQIFSFICISYSGMFNRQFQFEKQAKEKKLK